MIILRERRLLSWFKEVGGNFKRWGSDINDRYLSGPYKRNDGWQKIGGPVMAGGAVFTEALDQAVAGALDKRVEPATGLIGRTRRDAKEAVKDLFTGHPLRAVSDVIRLPGDIVMDTGDAVFDTYKRAA